MSASIKKNWWIALVGLVALGVAKLMLPESPEQPIEQAAPTSAPPVQQKKVDAPEPEAVITKLPKSTGINQDSPTQDDEFVEDVSFEDEDIEEKQNFILCEHIVSGETRYEFTGEIRLINKGTEPINGWSVQWEYADGSTIIDASDVALGGNNPYTGEYLSWNAEVAPGKTVTFSFTGVKGGETGPRNVEVKGEFCL